MKFYHHILYLIFALFLTACSEDFFEQTVEIDVPEHTPQLAITSQLNAGDTAVWVYLTHSQGILENSQAKLINDATVELFRDGQLMETLPYLDERFYVKDLVTPLSSDQVEFRLKISAPDYDPVEAVQQMPRPVPILSAIYESEGAINMEGDRVDEISVEIEDPAGEENYYQLYVFYLDDFGASEIYLDQLDPLVEELDEGQYLKDDTFDGKKYTWRVGFYPRQFDPAFGQRLLVQLNSVSRDKYFYERSVSLSYDADDNPFAEPVIIHGNVEGGQGIFSLSSKSEVVVEF